MRLLALLSGTWRPCLRQKRKEEKDPCHKFLSLVSVLLLLYLFGKLKDFPCFTCGTLYRDKNCMGATQEFMSFRCI